MAKKDPAADAMAKIAQLRHVSDPAELTAGLKKLLAEKSCFIVSRAADLCAERTMSVLLPDLVARLTRLLDDPKSDDFGCAASLALVRALVALEAGYDAEEVAIRASRLVRFESVMGGSVDVAVSVRGNATILLAAMGSTQALRVATEVLAEADQRPPRERTSWPARADAARALTMIGSDGAAALLRFKLLIGDAEPNVMSDCLVGLLTIERDAALPLAEQMLGSADDTRAEAAILAMGGWRDPRSFTVLRAHADRFLSSNSRDLFLASVAMTRRPEAIDYLIGLVSAGSGSLQKAARTALEPLLVLPGVKERVAKLKA